MFVFVHATVYTSYRFSSLFRWYCAHRQKCTSTENDSVRFVGVFMTLRIIIKLASPLLFAFAMDITGNIYNLPTPAAVLCTLSLKQILSMHIHCARCVSMQWLNRHNLKQTFAIACAKQIFWFTIECTQCHVDFISDFSFAFFFFFARAQTTEECILTRKLNG